MDIQQPTQPVLPVKDIVIVPGHNPRTSIDPVALAELAETIKAVGLMQPILVRLINGIYELVAGERRLRAFIIAFGEESSIPVFIRVMNDEASANGAMIENIDREPMSEVDEAEAAAKVLARYNGDRDETARRLGWKRPMLDARLALMYASDKVRAALQAKKILLGHAELLAACRKESQDAAVDHLLTQEKMMTVAELKAYLETNALVLDSAIFEKTECAACHHNSGNQASLFAEAISGGRCTNKQCFDAKTEAQINAQVEALKDEFQVVRVVRPGDNLTVIQLVAEGPKGVGKDQASACKVCKDFGAVVSSVPDKLGREYKNMCMNVTCNTQHVAAKLKAEKEAAKTQPADAGGSEAGPKTTEPGAKAPDAKAGAATKSTPKVAASSEPSNRVKEYREKLWRKIFARAVGKLAVADNRMVLMALCLTNPSVINRFALSKALEPVMTANSVTNGPAELLSVISQLDQAQLGSALNHIAASVNDSGNALAIKDVSGILKFFDIKIENYWKVDKTFIDLLTKNEIDAVCEEIGIKTAMGAEYAKLRNGPKEEYITAVVSVKDFDYRGRIPTLVRY